MDESETTVPQRELPGPRRLEPGLVPGQMGPRLSQRALVAVASLATALGGDRRTEGGPTPAPTPPGGPDLTGPWELFVDSERVQNMTNVRRRYHQFIKHASNPVLTNARVRPTPTQGPAPPHPTTPPHLHGRRPVN